MAKLRKSGSRRFAGAVENASQLLIMEKRITSRMGRQKLAYHVQEGRVISLNLDLL